MTSASSVRIPRRQASLCLLLAAWLPLAAVSAAELTGRVSVLGAAARARPGDIGHAVGGSDTPRADQQSLRLMLDEVQGDGEWSVHLKATRLHLRGYPAPGRGSSALFRYRDLAGSWVDESDGIRATRIGYEVDRALYRRRFGALRLSVGRQPIDWGRGRFWQPLNVLGAFAPTDLDTDYKPGIDAVVLEGYPSAFSSLTAVQTLSAHDIPDVESAQVLHYRRSAGERTEVSLLGARVLGNDIIGASLEGDWRGTGWRVEAAHYRARATGRRTLFWIAGLDHRFANGTLLVVEWHDNQRGASEEAALAQVLADPLVASGLQQHLGRRVLGVALEHELTPLLRGSYRLLVSGLRDASDRTVSSALHQLSFVYSLGNESDLLLSLQTAYGRGLNERGEPRSEFGHLPPGLTLRWRFYF